MTLLGVGNDPFLALQGAISLSRPPDVLLRSEAFIQETRLVIYRTLHGDEFFVCLLLILILKTVGEVTN